MHPRKLAKTSPPPSGKSRPRKRLSTSSSPASTPSSPPNTTSSSSIQQSEPASPLSWFAGISTMTLSSSGPLGAYSFPTGSSSGSASSSSSSRSSRSFQPHPTPTDRRQRPQSIPISFLINPVPQSPRPFTFSSPAPLTPSPPPLEASSVEVVSQIDSLSNRSLLFNPQCRSASPTLPPAAVLPHQHFASIPSHSLSGRRSYSTSSLSSLNTHGNTTLAPSTVNQTIRSGPGTSVHSAAFSILPTASTSNRTSIGYSAGPFNAGLIDSSSSSTKRDLLPLDSAISSSSSSSSSSTVGGRGRGRGRGNSRSSNTVVKDEEQQQQQQAIGSEERSPTPPRQVSLRRTTNPDLKTTKTGKIQHKSKKAGVNRKSTAYNRFLQQQSKYLAKHFPHLTPQQRMKRIAEEWAVSEKNAHTTRRRSRFPTTPTTTTTTTEESQAERTLDPATSSSLPPPTEASSSSSFSGAATGSASVATNMIAASHDPPSTAIALREAGPLSHLNSALFTSTTIARAAASRSRMNSSDCIPPPSSSTSPYSIEEEDRIEE